MSRENGEGVNLIKNVLEYLETSVKHFPHKTAFIDETSSCTFAELQHRAHTMGSALASRVPAATPIPVFLEKSVATLGVFMGIVSAGCFYVALDVRQPQARLRQIMQTLQAPVIITDEKHLPIAQQLGFSGDILTLETLLQTPPNLHLLQARRSQALDIDPLYGIFTSGSTGVPKCVLVSHRSVIDFMEYFTDLFHITSQDILGNQAPFDFDVSVKDIYSTLKTGATLVLIPRTMFSNPTQLLDYLSEHRVTTLIWAVSALCLLTTFRAFDYKVPPTINKVLFSGEAMPIKHLNLWQAAYPKATFVNLYGPTEITCNCTYYIIDRPFQPGDVLPMGKPFPNERVFLLNESNQLITKPHITGELCVSGTALALGYYNNPEQTANAFVQNPLNPHYLEVIYRTGDLAYYNDQEELCFASRKDFQIKHMGQRIELGEIEACLDKIPTLKRACCLYQHDKQKIVVFYEGDCEKDTLLQFLKTELPPYMIPHVFHALDTLPLNKNGKIDREVLKKQLESR